jgi:ubiquinone biosynthesis protein
MSRAGDEPTAAAAPPLARGLDFRPGMIRTLVRFFVILGQLLYQTVRYLGGRLGILALALRWDADRRRERAARLAGKCVVDFLRNLGPTFIKLGQIMSARPDVLPPHVIAELRLLQNQLPPFAFSTARRTIEEDLGRPLEELFGDFEKQPLSAASIAQVHEGHLHTGEHVAVKVQRPEIEDTIRRDGSILRAVASLFHLIPGLRNLQLPKLEQAFARAILAQLDFPLEIRNNRRFAENFKELDFVRLPEIYDEHCGPRVITMSFVQGEKLTEVLDDPPLDRPLMAKRIIDIYFQMAFEDFLLHSDLHPGNILVEPDGTYVLIDTGLVTEVPFHYLRKYLRVSIGVMLLDGRIIADGYLEGYEISPEKRRAAAADIERLAEKYRGKSFFEVEETKVILELLGVMRRHRIYLDAEWTGLVLSDVTFEGIAKMVSEDVDFLKTLIDKLPAYVERMQARDPGFLGRLKIEPEVTLPLGRPGA